MDISEIYEKQIQYVQQKFMDIAIHADVVYSESGIPLKLRLYLIDGSVIYVFYSVTGKYSYHWERRIIDGTIYRHDNAPHTKWKDIKTFPKHFHDGSDSNGKESLISEEPLIALDEFLNFARRKIIGGLGE